MEQDQQQAVPLPQENARQQDAILPGPAMEGMPGVPLERGNHRRQAVQPAGQQRRPPQLPPRQPELWRKAPRRRARQHNPKEGWFCGK